MLSGWQCVPSWIVSLPTHPGAELLGQTAQMEVSLTLSAATPRGLGAVSSVCSIFMVLSSKMCVAASRTTSSRFLFMMTFRISLAKVSSKTAVCVLVFHSRRR